MLTDLICWKKQPLTDPCQTLKFNTANLTPSLPNYQPIHFRILSPNKTWIKCRIPIISSAFAFLHPSSAVFYLFTMYQKKQVYNKTVNIHNCRTSKYLVTFYLSINISLIQIREILSTSKTWNKKVIRSRSAGTHASIMEMMNRLQKIDHSLRQGIMKYSISYGWYADNAAYEYLNFC